MGFRDLQGAPWACSTAVYGAPFLLIATLAPGAYAQTSPGDQAEALQREQQIRNQQDQDRILDGGNRTRIAPPAPDIPPPGTGLCFDIETIDLRGTEILTEADERTLVAPYEGRCLDVGGVQGLLGTITGELITRGYAATRTYLPEQDLTTGALVIDIVDGEVSALVLEGGGANLATAFPGIVGQTLNLRQLEQGLDQINRLPANRATVDLVPGEAAGETVVRIVNDRDRIISGVASYDNTGVPGTGRQQAGLTATASNLLGVNDLISYSRRGSLPLREDNKYSQSDTAIVSVPYGRALFTVSHTQSRYESEPPGTNFEIELSGESKRTSAGVDILLHRNQTDIFTASAGITGKANVNFFNDVELDVSSRTLAIVDVSLEMETVRAGGLGTVRLGVSQGVEAFGALSDPRDLPDDAPQAQFTRLNASASYTKPFEAGGKQFVASTAWTAQYGFDPLFSSEQMTIGGPFSVRGYLEETLANEQGAFARNEVTWTNAVRVDRPVRISLSPYAAFDVGKVGSTVSTSTPSGWLSGAAVGVKASVGRVSVNAFAAKPIHRPDAFQKDATHAFVSVFVPF